MNGTNKFDVIEAPPIDTFKGTPITGPIQTDQPLVSTRLKLERQVCSMTRKTQFRELYADLL